MKKLLVLFAVSIALGGSIFAQKKASKEIDYLAPTMFFITIEHNGEKMDIKSTQFENWGGTAATNDSAHGLMSLGFRAGNDKKNDDNFSFEGSIGNDEKGTFPLEVNQTHFTFMATKLPPELLCQNGTYQITAMGLKFGYVEGTFSANCKAPSSDGEKFEDYNLSGSFKLWRAY
ncbi:MAG: hypothetical protein ACR2HG_00470 [Pyrinomonadaceae bacterium]